MEKSLEKEWDITEVELEKEQKSPRKPRKIL
jgi:hypothetical protein